MADRSPLPVIRPRIPLPYLSPHSMRSSPIPAFLLSSMLVLSCAEKPVAPAHAARSESKLIGRIASVHSRGNFALIQSYGPWNIESGTILASVGEKGRTANLRVTGEKTGQFAAADIQSGSLEVGDAVFSTLSVSKPETFEPVAIPDDSSSGTSGS
ncbi:MAG: hypothetical protein RL346_364 [Verrucomicrobiota bacterium]